MTIGFIGLGKMGLNMVTRLIEGGHKIIVSDISDKAVKQAQGKGARASGSIEELVKKLDKTRVVWVMVPSGKPTEETVNKLGDILEKGDIVIDGGNSFYKDSMKTAETLKRKGILFLDAGTSGGIWGLKEGYCLMVGGEKAAFKKTEPLFKVLAPKDGYLHTGPSGSGHFVKMIHNGIEYAMLEAYGEGFEIMKANKSFDLDFEKISKLWNRGSVIRSWMLELAETAFGKEKSLDSISGYVEDSGEGRWTVAEAMDSDTPAPVITLSLMKRFRSRQKESFSAKFIAALRNEFGGHSIKKK